MTPQEIPSIRFDLDVDEEETVVVHLDGIEGALRVVDLDAAEETPGVAGSGAADDGPSVIGSDTGGGDDESAVFGWGDEDDEPSVIGSNHQRNIGPSVIGFGAGSGARGGLVGSDAADDQPSVIGLDVGEDEPAVGGWDDEDLRPESEQSWAQDSDDERAVSEVGDDDSVPSDADPWYSLHPTAPSIFAALAVFREAGCCTDVTIRCRDWHDREFLVHSAVVRSQSPFLDRALGEALTPGYLLLEEDNLDATDVEAILDFLYRGTYDDSLTPVLKASDRASRLTPAEVDEELDTVPLPRGTASAADQTPGEELHDALCFAVNIYAHAKLFEVPSLQLFARDRFCQLAEQAWAKRMPLFDQLTDCVEHRLQEGDDNLLCLFLNVLYRARRAEPGTSG